MSKYTFVSLILINDFDFFPISNFNETKTICNLTLSKYVQIQLNVALVVFPTHTVSQISWPIFQPDIQSGNFSKSAWTRHFKSVHNCCFMWLSIKVLGGLEQIMHNFLYDS